MDAAQRAAGVDLEALETAIRAAVLAAGGPVLEGLLRKVGVGRRHETVRSRSGCLMQSTGVVPKPVHTLLGPIHF